MNQELIEYKEFKEELVKDFIENLSTSTGLYSDLPTNVENFDFNKIETAWNSIKTDKIELIPHFNSYIIELTGSLIYGVEEEIKEGINYLKSQPTLEKKEEILLNDLEAILAGDEIQKIREQAGITEKYEPRVEEVLSQKELCHNFYNFFNKINSIYSSRDLEKSALFMDYKDIKLSDTLVKTDRIPDKDEKDEEFQKLADEVYNIYLPLIKDLREKLAWKINQADTTEKDELLEYYYKIMPELETLIRKEDMKKYKETEPKLPKKSRYKRTTIPIPKQSPALTTPQIQPETQEQQQNLAMQPPIEEIQEYKKRILENLETITNIKTYYSSFDLRKPKELSEALLEEYEQRLKKAFENEEAEEFQKIYEEVYQTLYSIIKDFKTKLPIKQQGVSISSKLEDIDIETRIETFYENKEMETLIKKLKPEHQQELTIKTIPGIPPPPPANLHAPPKPTVINIEQARQLEIKARQKKQEIQMIKADIKKHKDDFTQEAIQKKEEKIEQLITEVKEITQKIEVSQVNKPELPKTGSDSQNRAALMSELTQLFKKQKSGEQTFTTASPEETQQKTMEEIENLTKNEKELTTEEIHELKKEFKNLLSIAEKTPEQMGELKRIKKLLGYTSSTKEVAQEFKQMTNQAEKHETEDSINTSKLLNPIDKNEKKEYEESRDKRLEEIRNSFMQLEQQSTTPISTPKTTAKNLNQVLSEELEQEIKIKNLNPEEKQKQITQLQREINELNERVNNPRLAPFKKRNEESLELKNKELEILQGGTETPLKVEEEIQEPIKEVKKEKQIIEENEEEEEEPKKSMSQEEYDKLQEDLKKMFGK